MILNSKQPRQSTKPKASWLKIIAISLCLIISAAPIYAEGEELPLTEREKTIFAFFKITNGSPIYQDIIETMPEYKAETSMYHKQELYEKELLRLKWNYGLFDPNEHYIKINTDIYFSIEIDNKTPVLKASFSEIPEKRPAYFPYEYGQEWISLIPNEIENFTRIPLSKERFQKLRPILGIQSLRRGKVTIELRPKHADNKQSMQLDGLTQWLLTSDIAKLEYTYTIPETGETHSLLGTYKAEWYGEKPQQKLLNLFKN